MKLRIFFKKLQLHGEAAYVVCASHKVVRVLIDACLPVFEIGVAEFVGPEEAQGQAIVVGEGVVVVFAIVKDKALAKTRPGGM